MGNEEKTKHEPLDRSDIEDIKENSRGLIEPVNTELDAYGESFSEAAAVILKHHGIYTQDDRDKRLSHKKAGLGPLCANMVRFKLPCQRMSASQYLICDQLTEQFGDGGLRITSRGNLEFHGVMKPGLRPLIHELIMKAGLSTFAAAGDVVRGTVVSPVADIDPRYGDIGDKLTNLAYQIGTVFTPVSAGYELVWDGRTQKSEDLPDPLYGSAYLPRKFKIVLAVPFDNLPEVHANDVGILAAEDGSGYELIVGGGLGYSRVESSSWPRLATPFAFVEEDDVLPVLLSVVKIFRDYGDRRNRFRARLKYLIDDRGTAWFREEVGCRLGRPLPPARGLEVTGVLDILGPWPQKQRGYHYLGVWVENGGIHDQENGPQYKTAFRAVLDRYGVEIRFTSRHQVVFAWIRDTDMAEFQRILADYGVPAVGDVPEIRRGELSCPALPWCGRAMAEAERIVPGIIRRLIEAGHGGESLTLRFGGCTHNCVRTRTAELGVSGRGPGRYQIFVGGDPNGTRLNELLLDDVSVENLVPVLSTLLSEWRMKRKENMRFGDWARMEGTEALSRLLST